MKTPPNTQICEPSSHAVLPPPFYRGPFTPSYYTESVTRFPLSLSAPFVVVHSSFLDILGPSPLIKVIASSEIALGGDGRGFAHEAGIYVQETNEVWFTSSGTYLSNENRNQISKIKLDSTGETDRSFTSSWEEVHPDPVVPTCNGGTRFGKHLLFCSQGIGSHIPSSLTLVDPLPPHKSTPILNNFHGRAFNSVNDIAVLPPPSSNPSFPHPTTDRSETHHLPHTTIFFTDPTYGYVSRYKPKPELPNQVYCFNPTTGDVRVVADGFNMPNGIAFSHDGARCFVTDTGIISKDKVGPGLFKMDGAKQGTIYVFDVGRPPFGADLTAFGPTLHNRRVFAFCDCGAPDGIACDKEGNVYSGCGDGIQVWNSNGTLIGKILLLPDKRPSTLPPPSEPEHKARYSNNFNFVPGGKLIVFAEDRIYEVALSDKVEGALL